MNSHWGVGASDLSHKSPREIIANLVACRAVGGNLLMNMGPLGDGSTLARTGNSTLVGRWCAQCPEAVYDAVPVYGHGLRGGSSYCSTVQPITILCPMSASPVMATSPPANPAKACKPSPATCPRSQPYAGPIAMSPCLSASRTRACCIRQRPTHMARN